MPNDPHDKPLEFSQIDDQVFIGTNACCRTHFDEKLLSQGVTADVSLEEKHLDMPSGVTEFVWLPTPDHTPPSRASIDVGLAALDAMLRAGQKVYIHCKNGHGRAPTFYAAHLVRHRGMTADQALELIKTKRPSVHFEESQRAFLREIEAAGPR